jgi:thioredoxin 1
MANGFQIFRSKDPHPMDEEYTESDPSGMTYTKWACVLGGILLAAVIIFRPGGRSEYVGPNDVLRPQSMAEFTALVGASTSKPAVLKFYADWCGPCRVYDPIFSRASGDKPDEVNYISINVDNLGEVAQRYGVSGIPCTIAVDKNGKELSRLVGVVGETQIMGLAQQAKSQ